MQCNIVQPTYRLAKTYNHNMEVTICVPLTAYYAAIDNLPLKCVSNNCQLVSKQLVKSDSVFEMDISY